MRPWELLGDYFQYHRCPTCRSSFGIWPVASFYLESLGVGVNDPSVGSLDRKLFHEAGVYQHGVFLRCDDDDER